ncbi:MAG: AraC family transcriptional regulator [Jaaginema sp. PMC 1079.18]|nr:AraC family transcriptional regulator [Jaaginema sp. PMC 1080.18]MEC4849797.1 AraC family transcriptional regulator [Jaaginema sp. PMC 1079.18]MEC4866879.1 AraC family transcriptional regulator [Jaaginema sp. PMC 1078.18]
MATAGLFWVQIVQNPDISPSQRDRAFPSVQTTPPEKMRVTPLQNPPGEGHYHATDCHTLFISLAPRPVRYRQSQDGKTYKGLCRSGDMLITPANVPLSVGWQDEEDCLQIQLTEAFLCQIAQETLNRDSDRLLILPQFQVRDPEINNLATLLLTESSHNAGGSQLYLDSLANLLALNLLRHHSTTKPSLTLYEGGLPTYQLQTVFDYIEAHLEQNLKLETLAQLLDMSQFHFSRLFKQSVGLAPYQYLTQQRVERAKQLLKQTDQSIIDIALECGFNSHSHLSKRFRQLTGMTPKVYRISVR